MKKEKVIMRSQCCAKNGEMLYFFSHEINVLYSYNLEKNEMEILGSVPEKGVLQEFVSTSIEYFENKIYVIPLNINKLWVFDLKTRKWNALDFLKERYKNIGIKFWRSYIFEQKLYMFGCRIPYIVCIDLISYEVIYIEIPEINYNAENALCFSRGLCCVNNVLYIPFLTSNQILEFNLVEKSMKRISIGDIANRYMDLDWDGDKFWIAPHGTKKFVIWDGKDGVEEFAMPKEFEKKQPYILYILVNDKRVIMGGSRGISLIIDKNNPLNTITEHLNYDLCNIISDDCSVIADEKGNISCFCAGELLHEYKSELSKQELYRLLSINEKGNDISSLRKEIIQESNIVSCYDYLELILTWEKSDNIADRVNNGNEIYKFINHNTD